MATQVAGFAAFCKTWHPVSLGSESGLCVLDHGFIGIAMKESLSTLNG